MNNKFKQYLIPYDVIEAATNGDVIAIETVLKHYEGYIAKLSMRQQYDYSGRLQMRVDEELRGRLYSKLAAAILKFKIG